jgi:hypothetical protein
MSTDINYVFSENRTKHVNSLYGQKAEFFILNIVVYKVTIEH